MFKKLINQKSRFSIRKFSFGAASIIIGSTLLLGAANNEAHAEQSNEYSSQNSVDSQSDESTSSKDNDAQQVNERNNQNSVQLIIWIVNTCTTNKFLILL